jgi:hypothetical protein
MALLTGINFTQVLLHQDKAPAAARLSQLGSPRIFFSDFPIAYISFVQGKGLKMQFGFKGTHFITLV